MSHRLSCALEMVEGLIAAHQAAKRYADRSSLDLIEAALRHAGERLAEESEDDDRCNRAGPQRGGGSGDNGKVSGDERP